MSWGYIEEDGSPEFEASTHTSTETIKPLRKGDETRTLLHTKVANSLIEAVNKNTELIRTMSGKGSIQVRVSDSNVVISDKREEEEYDPKTGTYSKRQTSTGNTVVMCQCRYA